MVQSSDESFNRAKLEALIRELKEALYDFIQSQHLQSHRPANEIILDDDDLQKILKASKRYTSYLRESGLIGYSQPVPNGKVFYTLQNVIDFIESGRVPPISKKRKF